MKSVPFGILSKENIMSPKQYKRVKLYRALKVLFYCCGLPLFVLAVFFTAVKFIGHDPFNGAAILTDSSDIMESYERTLGGSSLYGVWCAFGIWAIIAVFQIIFAKTIKNRRARMFATVAVTLVLMLGGLLVIDTVYARKIDGFTNPINGEHTNGIRDNAPDGVVVEAYRTQLSYYRTISTEALKKDLSRNLIDKVDLLKRVYNVKMEGEDKIGSAGNVSNDAITYATIISDDGQMGVDISFKDGKLQLEEVGKRAVEHKALLGGSKGTVVDNNILKGDDNQSLPSKNWHWGLSSEKAYDPNSTVIPDFWDPLNPRYLGRNGELCQEAEQVVRLAPNANGQLVINGIVFSHYVPVARTDLAGNEYYVWYAKDLYPVNYDFAKKKGVAVDGIYGKAIYNKNGNIADGWVFSFENVLEILEDYYGAPVHINDTLAAHKELGTYDALRGQIVAAGAARRQEYYTTGDASAWEKALYRQEVYNSNKFSFTHYRLDALLAEVGNMLGRNALFDYLFSPDAVIGSLIQPILQPLRDGVKLTEFLKGQFGLGDDVCDTVMGIVKKIADDDTLTDAYIRLFYPASDEDGHFTLTLKKNDAAGDIILDIDFSNELLEYKEENPDFAFDLDHLSAFLNKTLNKFIDLSSMKDGIVGTLVNLLGGMIDAIDTSNGVALNIDLLSSKVHIQILDKDFKFAIDIDEILLTLLDGLYYYESSCIQPVWNFYVDPAETKETMRYIEAQFADYDRAYFTGTKYGALIGSTLIGKTLGGNLAMSGGISYDAKYGLTDYVSVLQIKSDLSYMPYCFPIYGFRDMLALFSGTVVLFVFLSYYAAEKEYLFATGQLVPKDRKNKKKKGEEENLDGETAAPTSAEEPAPENSEPVPAAEEKPLDPPAEEKPAEEPAPEEPKKGKKDKKSKKGKGEPAQEGTDVPVQENSDKEVR